MRRLIGVIGFKESGKSTVANMLIANGFERAAFAGPLKAMLATLGLSEAQLYGDEKETPSPLLAGKTPRHAMQTLGTEWGRDLIGKDLWRDAWRARVDLLELAVCDDCRFPNEAEEILSRGGQIWRVTRPGKAGDGHESESHIATMPVTLELDNSGTLAQLAAQVAWELERTIRGG